MKRNIARFVPSMKNASAAAREVMMPAVAAGRQAVQRGLRRRLQHDAQVGVVALQRLVVRVAGRRVGRRDALADVDDVVREHAAEVDVVAHHADHGRGVIVERREHRLVAVGPRRREVLQRRRCRTGSSAPASDPGCTAPAATLSVATRCSSIVEQCRRRRRAGEPVVHALRLPARQRIGRRILLHGRKGGDRERQRRGFHEHAAPRAAARCSCCLLFMLLMPEP